MASLKRRAREKGTGRFIAEGTTSTQPDKEPVKRVGRPRKKVQRETNTFELSITISIGGSNISTSLLDNINDFLVKEFLAGKCSVERGGTAYHLHFQMIVRIQAATMVSVPRLLKTYLGWDKSKPPGAIVICKKLSNKGLHTFHGMIGYCMKDAEQDHFQTVDHNISADDIVIGLEQLALYGQEECKTRIMLTQRNFAQKCLTWRRYNYKHPAAADWQKEFYQMMKSGKYYPCTSWVVGTYGRGYEPHRMQSYWKMLVNPATISLEDVTNVFSQPEQISFPSFTRQEWFKHRWEQVHPVKIAEERKDTADESIAEVLMGMKSANEHHKEVLNNDTAAEILIHTPTKCRASVGEAAEILTHTPAKCRASVGEGTSKRRKGKWESSPLSRFRPEEWNIHEETSEEESSRSVSTDQYESVLPFGHHAPVYNRSKMRILVS